ncbi:winged helix-turn-helix domain-containing protein [Halovenus halobia]|uniref:winged helix-turn-helix domain-containing protein n=1 Tax=Halovenus halobia TaxID=3396622 RepID=UPI003F57A418
MTLDLEGLHKGEKKLLNLLDGQSMYFTEIVEHEEVDVAKPTVSSRLKELKRLDLIQSERLGQKRFYSTTEARFQLKNLKKTLEAKAEQWVEACREQVLRYERGEISPQEFMQQTYATLVPLFPMRIWGMAYIWALDFDKQDFFDKPDGDLDRKQEELLKHAYAVCRRYEIQGIKTLHTVDYDSISGEISDYLNTPNTAILAVDEIQLFEDKNDDS